MKIYLAARYGRRMEINGYAERLRRIGHEITSAWLSGDAAEDDISPAHHVAAFFAKQDLTDIDTADALVLFGECPGEEVAGATRGGRMVEFGFALAKRKRVYVVGYRENIFCHHERVCFVESFAMLELILLDVFTS